MFVSAMYYKRELACADGVYATDGRPSVCSSVHPSRLAATSRCKCLLLCALRAGDIDRSLHGRQASGQQQRQRSGVRRQYAGSATLSAYVVAEHKRVHIAIGRFPKTHIIEVALFNDLE